MKVTWDPNTRTAYLGSQDGNVAVNELRWFNVTPDFTHDGMTYYTKSRNTAVLTTATGKVFEFGYTYEDPGYYAVYSIHFNTDYQYQKFKATFWVDEVKNESGEYISQDPVIEIRDEHESVIKKIEAQWGNLYEVEVDIQDVQRLSIWVSGSKSIIGEPKVAKP